MHNWVYILRCSNQSLYTGSTNDPERRLAQHCSGKGAKYTRAFKPLAMVACWRVEGELGEALKIEAAIKKLSRATKEQLITEPRALAEIIPCPTATAPHPCAKIADAAAH